MFKSPIEFSLFIEETVKDSNITYVEAVLNFCDKNSVDPSEIKHMISKSLKDKIELNMIELGLLPKGVALPESYFND